MRPPQSLSNSRMKALNCPFQFASRYLAPNYHEPDSIQARRGTIGHKVAEDYIAHLARTNRKRDEEAYGDIIRANIEGLPAWFAQPILDVGERFVGVWELDKRAVSHTPELLLVVDRAGNPTDHYIMDDDGHIQATDIDIVTGRIDYRGVFSRGRRSEIWDFKMGEEHVSSDSASLNQQLLLYAAMDFWTNPIRERVLVRLWGVKYGRRNISEYEYTRETACPAATARIESYFGILDALWPIDPRDWPALATSPQTCEFCAVCHLCPENVARLETLRLMDPIKDKTPRRKRSV